MNEKALHGFLLEVELLKNIGADHVINPLIRRLKDVANHANLNELPCT